MRLIDGIARTHPAGQRLSSHGYKIRPGDGQRCVSSVSHSSPRLCVPLPSRPPPQARVPPHSLPFDPPHSLSPPTPLLPFLRRRQPSPPNDEPKGLLLGIVQRWGTEWLLFCALKGPGSSTAREQEVASPGHGRATWPVLPPRRRLPCEQKRLLPLLPLPPFL